MGTYSDTDKTVLRIARTDEEIREARNQDARVVVAGRALKRPDTEEFLIDVLEYLGLDGKTDSPPSPVRMFPPDEIGVPTARAKTATARAEPDDEEKRPRGRPTKSIGHDAEHGTRATYYRGCDCDRCKAAANKYNREWSRKRTAEKRAAREAAGFDQP